MPVNPSSLVARPICSNMTERVIRRGDIWLINFDPTIGAEIRKTRPGLVISSDALGLLPLRLIAPITGWKQEFGKNLWHVRITPDKSNGLQKELAIDTIQIRSMDERRFLKRLGKVPEAILKETLYALFNVLDHIPE